MDYKKIDYMKNNILINNIQSDSKKKYIKTDNYVKYIDNITTIITALEDKILLTEENVKLCSDVTAEKKTNYIITDYNILKCSFTNSYYIIISYKKPCIMFIYLEEINFINIKECMFVSIGVGEYTDLDLLVYLAGLFGYYIEKKNNLYKVPLFIYQDNSYMHIRTITKNKPIIEIKRDFKLNYNTNFFTENIINVENSNSYYSIYFQDVVKNINNYFKDKNIYFISKNKLNYRYLKYIGSILDRQIYFYNDEISDDYTLVYEI